MVKVDLHSGTVLHGYTNLLHFHQAQLNKRKTSNSRLEGEFIKLTGRLKNLNYVATVLSPHFRGSFYISVGKNPGFLEQIKGASGPSQQTWVAL